MVVLLLNVMTVNAAGWWGNGGFGPGPWNGNEGGMTHGTTDVEITEDMLNNTPPADYVVNEATQGDAAKGDYNAFFLEDSVQTVSIEIDENNLNYLLQNATDEPSVMATSVTIGDVTLGYCGLKTKGNYTLEHSFTDNPGSDRFSFTINFGKYIKKAEYGQKQNFYGANKISFNNFYFDKSMMKEFFALKLMDEMGLPTPQYGLAKLYINGNYYGVYAMVEAFDESILEQYYGVDDDELSNYLCKPTDTNFIYDELLEDDSPLWEYDEETYEDVKEMLPTVMEWARKLNCLSAGTDFDGNSIDVNSEEYLGLLGQIMDVDAAVRYFATHSWLCQMDNMFVEQQNFGLYVDANGKCLLMPWDYDLSFGCYFPSEAESTANYDIEVMYRGVAEGNDQTYPDYPLFYVIYQNDSLMAQYREYMKACSKIATLGGSIEHTGKAYDPGYFNSFIERMEEDVYEAATEELADNVYYMNRTSQPNDVRAALPNLSKIIAMRSVGVLEQVNNTGAIVCGEGCDLSTLGNANRGRSSGSGLLTVVNEKSGIFVTAEYEATGDDRRPEAPILETNKVGEEDTVYQEIRSALGAKAEDRLLVYGMNTGVTPSSKYTVSIPLTQDYLSTEQEVHFYSFDINSGELTEIAMTADDNLYTGLTSSIEYILVYQGGGNAENGVVVGLIVVAGLILMVVALVLIKKFAKNNKKY